jgi:gluconate:H+ symporter, GntP family
MTSILGLSHEATLLLLVMVAVVGLVLLVAWCKVHAFLALILASLFVGLLSGLNPTAIAKAFQDGVGQTLQSIAVVVGLGTMLGKMLAESGGAEVISATFIRVLGPGRLHWAMMLVAFIVGLPVFFAVGLVLLMPILLTLVRDTRTPLLQVGIPMLAGLAVAHGLVPPHPGPMAAIQTLHADVGRTILYSILLGLPIAVVAGPLFGRFISARVAISPGGLTEALVSPESRRSRPGFSITLLTILLPVLLMLLATLAEVGLPPGHPVRTAAVFVGSPLAALLIAVLFSFYSFGSACGLNRNQILAFMESCVGPAANIMLVVGAGGGFGKMLDQCGAAQAIATLTKGLPLSPLLLGYLIAACIRLAVGSATVAITLAAGMMAPIAAMHAEIRPEFLVLALAAGSTVFSHLNDGGFWFVKEYFNLTVSQTLKTWSVMDTLISVLTLLGVLLLNALF